MRVVERIPELRVCRGEMEAQVGFVPTMGALHFGHKSLMERAREECEQVIVSIYVNPTQFGPGEDFESYPRTLEADLDVCRSAGVDLVWLPQTDEMYPIDSETTVQLDGLGRRFEGESRPAHFQGVATVVTKLFLATKCHRAYFGEKDLQQLFLIKKMTRDLLFDLEVIGVSTAREENGLARSSRNEYLSREERSSAGAIYRGLRELKRLSEDESQFVLALREAFKDVVLASLPSAEIERCDFYDSELSRAYQDDERVGPGFCAVAVKLGKVRLIDNIVLCS